MLPRKPDLLYLPSEPQRIHPLSKTMRLLLCKVSGDYSRVRDNTNLSYSAMNTARSALSLVIFPLEGGTFGNHPLVCRLLKGVFTTRLSLPRHQCIWVAIVLKYLKTLHPPEDLQLHDLTWKVNMLIALLSGQRCETIHALHISDM